MKLPATCVDLLIVLLTLCICFAESAPCRKGEFKTLALAVVLSLQSELGATSSGLCRGK